MHLSSACRKPGAVDRDPFPHLGGKELFTCNCSSLWQELWGDSVHHPSGISSRPSWVGGDRSSRSLLVWRLPWVRSTPWVLWVLQHCLGCRDGTLPGVMAETWRQMSHWKSPQLLLFAEPSAAYTQRCFLSVKSSEKLTPAFLKFAENGHWRAGNMFVYP